MERDVKNYKLKAVLQNHENHEYSERILKLAKNSTKLFIKKGYAQSSMREIAKATGINLGNIYNFIESKEDLLCLFFDMFHDSENWVGRDDIQNMDDPILQLRTAVKRGLQKACLLQREIVLMYREFKTLPKKAAQRVFQKESDFVSFFEDIIARGVERGVFDVDDPFLAANMIVYQISMFPLRSWNLKKYSDQESLELIEHYILKPILRYPPAGQIVYVPELSVK